MPTLQELLQEQASIDRQILEHRRAERTRAISEIRALMDQHHLTANDLAGADGIRKAGAKPGKKVAPKYRDPSNGATWSGRGLRPKWLSNALAAGKHLTDYAL